MSNRRLLRPTIPNIEGIGAKNNTANNKRAKKIVSHDSNSLNILTFYNENGRMRAHTHTQRVHREWKINRLALELISIVVLTLLPFSIARVLFFLNLTVYSALLLCRETSATSKWYYIDITSGSFFSQYTCRMQSTTTTKWWTNRFASRMQVWM